MVLAFDSKEYRREKVIDGVRQTTFYTPLGVGVKLDDSEEFRLTYRKICREKSVSHVIFEDCDIYSSSLLSKKYERDRASLFLESIIYGISDYIKQVYFLYVIISPEKYPKIKVGGHFSPTAEVSTFDFLKNLNPMFSYITAWDYLQDYKPESESIYIDAFSSKSTLAWEELKNYHPIIYPHGDECNLSISIADIFAFVTDRRLNRLHLRLKTEDIQEAWKGFDFQTDCGVLTYGQIQYISWYDYLDIDWKDYQSRPILFLDLEGINMKTMVELDAYKDAIKYIALKNGSLQGFDVNIDSKRIKDGDIYVYAGEESRKRAETFVDIYDLEIFSVKELRKRIREK
jgi:hypothetical protein